MSWDGAVLLGGAALLPSALRWLRKEIQISQLEARVSALSSMKAGDTVHAISLQSNATDLFMKPFKEVGVLTTGGREVGKLPSVLLTREIHVIAVIAIGMTLAFFPCARRAMGSLVQERPEFIEEDASKKSKEEPLTGNIYRLLAVCTPEMLGFKRYGSQLFAALLTLIMQLYLPAKIIKDVLKTHSCLGVKHPSYFIENWFDVFLASVPILQSTHLWCQKTYLSIHDEIKACYQHLAMKESEESRNTTLEVFWVVVSLVANMVSSLLLFVCMFLKVATFDGEWTGLAFTIMSLTWVNGLDDAAMKADPSFEKMYQEQMALQKFPAKVKPRWIKDIKHFMKPVFGLALCCGMVMAVGTYWIDSSATVSSQPGVHVGF